MAPAGTATVRLVAVAADTVAAVPLNFTVLSRRVVEKLVPVSVTTVPIVPDVGENPVSVGAVAAGGIGSSLSLHALHSRKKTKLRKSKLCRFLIREMIKAGRFHIVREGFHIRVFRDSQAKIHLGICGRDLQTISGGFHFVSGNGAPCRTGCFENTIV